jgi:sacsin
VSACLRLLDAPEPPPALSRRLGWTRRLPAAVLAGQLCELGKRFARVPPEDEALVAQLDCTVLQLYDAMSTALPADAPAAGPSAELEVLRAILEGARWVWVGDGFVQAAELCFDAVAHFPPYLFVVPSGITVHQPLLQALGVRATFEQRDYVAVLARLHADAAGEPLTPQQLTLALQLLEHIVEATLVEGAKYDAGASTAQVLHVPDSHAVMAPADQLVYDDAQWLAGNQRETFRLAHAELAHGTAERLGMKSLRYLLLVDQQMSSSLQVRVRFRVRVRGFFVFQLAHDPLPPSNCFKPGSSRKIPVRIIGRIE